MQLLLRWVIWLLDERQRIELPAMFFPLMAYAAATERYAEYRAPADPVCS